MPTVECVMRVSGWAWYLCTKMYGEWIKLVLICSTMMLMIIIEQWRTHMHTANRIECNRNSKWNMVHYITTYVHVRGGRKGWVGIHEPRDMCTM